MARRLNTLQILGLFIAAAPTLTLAGCAVAPDGTVYMHPCPFEEMLAPGQVAKHGCIQGTGPVYTSRGPWASPHGGPDTARRPPGVLNIPEYAPVVH